MQYIVTVIGQWFVTATTIFSSEVHVFVRKRLIGTALGLFALCAGGFASANAEELVLQNGANGYNNCFDTHFEEGQGSGSGTEDELVVGDNCPGG